MSRGFPRSGSPALCPLPPPPPPPSRRQIRAWPRVPAGGGAGGPQGRSLDVESKMGTAGGGGPPAPAPAPPKWGPKKSYRRQEAYTKIDSLKEGETSQHTPPSHARRNKSFGPGLYVCTFVYSGEVCTPGPCGPRGGGTGWRPRAEPPLLPLPCARQRAHRPTAGPRREPAVGARVRVSSGCAAVCARGRVHERCAPPHTAVPGACSAHKDGSFAITAGNDPLEAEIKSWEK